MTTIHLTVTTLVAPERIVRAFTDFTPQRLRAFPNIDPRYYQVHAVGATSAEVTEGSAFFGGVWERAHYDWTQPGDISITVHRVGKNLKGRMLATMLRVFGRRISRQDLELTLKCLVEESPVKALS